MKILGTNDAVNACECCGKSGLKFTVMVNIGGEVLHYGSTCATRHTGKTSSQIKQAIVAARDERKVAARKLHRATPEFLAYQAKLAEASRAGLRPGREFHAFVAPAANAADETARAIAAAHNLETWEIL